MGKVTKNEVHKLLDSLNDKFTRETIDEFDKDFPNVRGWIDKYAKDDPFNISQYIGSVNLDFKIGCQQFFPLLHTGDNAKYNWVIDGICTGELVNALETKCKHYTDIVRKLFRGVYKQLTTGEVVSVYDEYTKEEITEWYKNSVKDDKPLEHYLDEYVGKPKLSVSEFKTSNDVIEWYYNLQMLYLKMCQVDITAILNASIEKDNI